MYYYFGDYFGVVLIVSIVVACIMGAISKSINEGKGYYGGFAWGFWLGIIGVIVVACKEPAPTTPPVIMKSSETLNVRTSPNDWQCRCGRFNASYVSTCVCGFSKVNLNALQSTPEKKEPAPKSKAENEMDSLMLLKEYKNLLDSGVITAEEFEAKKQSLLKS